MTTISKYLQVNFPPLSADNYVTKTNPSVIYVNSSFEALKDKYNQTTFIYDKPLKFENQKWNFM